MNYRGRARGADYVPPRHTWTLDERLADCERIAARIESGDATPVDEIALVSHVRELKARLLMVRGAWINSDADDLDTALDLLLTEQDNRSRFEGPITITVLHPDGSEHEETL